MIQKAMWPQNSLNFNPSGKAVSTANYVDPSKTVISKIHYTDYNYKRSLKQMNVDIGNDGAIDMQYHYTFDDWNRLTEVYFNFSDQASEKSENS